MATVVIRKFVDDLDFSEELVATTPFAFEGVEYEIDLSNGNYVRLREFLEPYLKAARRVGGRATPRKVMAPSTAAAEPSAGKANGNGNGNGMLSQRSFVADIAPRHKRDPKAVRRWYAGLDVDKQARLGALSPMGAIPHTHQLAYDIAHGLAEPDDQYAPLPAPEPASNGNGNGNGNGHRDETVSTLVAFEAPAPAEQAEQPEPPEPTRTEIPPSGNTESAMIRAWYRDQPYRWRAENPLKDKGRIPVPIREAWKNDQVDA